MSASDNSYAEASEPVTAIVLAGRRSGRHDPLAVAANVPLKCLVPVAGKALIDHVLGALLASGSIGVIRIVVDETEVMERHLAESFPSPAKPVVVVPAAFDLVDSVIQAGREASFPVMITTGDNVMLTPETVDAFVSEALAMETGVALAMARREAIQAAHPQGQRKFYRFSDGEFANCNTYWIGDESAISAARVFRFGGQFIKFPSRIAKTFGIISLIRFYFGIGTVRANFDHIGRRLGFPVRMIELRDGAMAIDVDNESTHRITGKLLSERAAAA